MHPHHTEVPRVSPAITASPRAARNAVPAVLAGARRGCLGGPRGIG